MMFIGTIDQMREFEKTNGKFDERNVVRVSYTASRTVKNAFPGLTPTHRMMQGFHRARAKILRALGKDVNNVLDVANEVRAHATANLDAYNNPHTRALLNRLFHASNNGDVAVVVEYDNLENRPGLLLIAGLMQGAGADVRLSAEYDGDYSEHYVAFNKLVKNVERTSCELIDRAKRGLKDKLGTYTAPFDPANPYFHVT